MQRYLIFCFVCLLSAAAFDINDDIVWEVSKLGESHYETCKRVSLSPIQMGNYPMIWNVSNFEQVVGNLQRNISSNSSYGISGCCAPSLWCSSAGCFTQGFGSHFLNYGWLNNDTSSFPVYTCANTSSIDLVQISNQTLISDVLTIRGVNFGFDSDSIAVGLNTEICENVESCTCQSCLSDSCPLGQQCLHIDQEKYWNCFETCAGTGDDSCPCDFVCTPFSSTSLCIPQSLVTNPKAESSHSMACSISTLQCHIPRAYQEIYTTQVDSEVSLIVDSASSAATTTRSNLVVGHHFCKVNSDCQDGNVCTLDACDSLSGLCVYSSVIGCDSTPQLVRQQATPYAYRDLYFRNRTVQHQALKRQLLRNSTTISMSELGSFVVPNLGFSLVFFGNLVSRASISSTGVVSLPPINDCTAEDEEAQKCILFSTSTNVIAPWFAIWNASASGSVSIRLQSESEEASVHGLQANALHVLFSDMIPEGNVTLSNSQSNSSTFSASLYEDGSVRLSYLQVHPLHAHPGDFSGMWGSVVTEKATNGQSRYHMENVSRVVLDGGGVDVVYCPFSTIACIPQSCVTAGSVLSVRWNGTDSCSALGGNETISLYCEWAGGVVPKTAATFVPSLNSTFPATVTCAVPFMDFSDGQVLTVDLVVEAKTDSVVEDWRYLPEQRVSYESRQLKTVYGAVLGNGTELARTNLQIRYYNSSGGERGGCGCSALPAYGGYACDSLNVCGGDASTKDCAGSPFGSAYASACGTCSGGLTGVTPVFTCSGSSSSGGNFLSLISQTIILLMIICCMTFITSTASFSIRRMLANRHMDDGDDVFEDYTGGDLRDVERPTPRGLSEFECEALGQVVFSTDFYVAHKKAQLEAMHGVQGVLVSEKSAKTEVSAPPASSSSCDCSICLMDILEGNVCRVLPDPCGHIFHMACIDQWFKQSTACPLCKRNMKSILEGEDEDAHFPVRDNLTGRGYHAVNAPPHRPFVAMESINRFRNSLFQQSATVSTTTVGSPSATSSSVPEGIVMTDLQRNRERGAVDV